MQIEQSAALKRIEQAAAPLIAKGMSKALAQTQVIKENPNLYIEYVGTTGTGSAVLKKIEQAAAPLIAKGMSKAQAETKVIRDNPRLYAEYVEGQERETISASLGRPAAATTEVETDRPTQLRRPITYRR